ncbi:6'-aminoglycoside N-acetyltransferase [Reticulibacter mediterranei]|uniref:6'-aminoglycoside N-acetyltransferase n=1 Tax=Reticulibacter mediterranei TaxID=2778369 RepID=A0A8J3IPR4_9CHLR|nr:aminoglycoside phosphotransferase family protein [Reticulibacter mediterranei]GHO99689.1 6'-aminoglycoside N-acetyltransferase [Reticulibacter mediterranei]
MRIGLKMGMQQALTALHYAFPQLRIASALPVTRGRDNFVLQVNHNLIFRFPRNGATEAQLMREIKILPLLVERLTAPVPHFSYLWLPDDYFPSPFVGYSKLQGIWLNDPRIVPPMQKQLLPSLAQFFAELHQFPLNQAQNCDVKGGDVTFWVALYRRRFEQIQAAVFPHLSESMQQRAQQRWEAYLERHASLSFAPTLIHRDLWLHHLLCDPEQGTLCGVIDWGEVAIGDPALDFMGLYLRWGRERMEEIRSLAKLAPDPTFWQRLDFYREFYFQFYPPYTEAFKAAQSQDYHVLEQHVHYIQSTLR